MQRGGDTGDLERRISVRNRGDAREFLLPGSVRLQSLRGFDEDYTDIVHYILRCTHKIWEEHGIGWIDTHYDPEVQVWTSEGLSRGVQAVIRGTGIVQAAFPDVRLFADDVIWAGDEDNGFHTSHRISWVGHNTGHSSYGPPTGRRIYRFGIANCLVVENRIVEEWIARDELGLIKQLGFDPWRAAARLAQRPEKKDRRPAVPAGVPGTESGTRRAKGGNPDGFDIEDFVRTALEEIWNRRLLDRIDRCHVPNYRFHGPSNRLLFARGSLKAFILSMFAAFPDLSMEIDHLYWNGNDKDGYRVAVRFNLHGHQTGPGIYGRPTGKRVRIMAISHMHVHRGRFVEEWTVFDEFALLKQLYTPEVHGVFEES